VRVGGRIISRGCSCGELGSLEVNGLRYSSAILDACGYPSFGIGLLRGVSVW